MASMQKILEILLIISLFGNAYFAVVSPMFAPQDHTIQDLQIRIDSLDRQVTELHAAREMDNLTIRSYSAQLDTYRQIVLELQKQLNASPTGLAGFATLQGPAVIQRPGMNPIGTMTNVSVEIRPGEGRVLVQTEPLMGIVFQDAANTAVFVAQNITGKTLTGSDVIFSVEAQDQIPAIDGPSAGALMTALVIASLENRQPRQEVTLTGTIDRYGRVGVIGGVVEKSQAAKDTGKTLILLPKENDRILQYTETTRRIGGFTIVERTPKFIDTKMYIEETVGIQVMYVESIQDVEQYLGL
ncbi:MAG: hypothetical protein LUQ17_00395 [Methanomicrobiales archaeon]|nr:hypothetical protein [Methanomicrobiales archaeon]